MDPETGIRQYCKRLAGIYKSEESIGGLPINMEDFRLFDAGPRSSRPLNLAFKAAQLADPEKSEAELLFYKLGTDAMKKPLRTCFAAAGHGVSYTMSSGVTPMLRILILKFLYTD